jgi:hypothetical protein
MTPALDVAFDILSKRARERDGLAYAGFHELMVSFLRLWREQEPLYVTWMLLTLSYFTKVNDLLKK